MNNIINIMAMNAYKKKNNFKKRAYFRVFHIFKIALNTRFNYDAYFKGKKIIYLRDLS